MCSRALCKLECIHSLEFQLNSNQGRRCQTLECDGQLLKRKPCSKLPPPGLGILTWPLQVEHLTRMAPAMLAGSCICQPPFLRPHHLPTESGSLPVSVPFPPSSPSRLPDRAGGSQQHWAVFPRRFNLCLDYKRPTFPIQLVLSSPFCHRDKPRKIWTLSLSDDKN